MYLFLRIGNIARTGTRRNVHIGEYIRSLMAATTHQHINIVKEGRKEDHESPPLLVVKKAAEEDEEDAHLARG